VNHAGADVLVGTIGPKRLVAPALTARQLPRVDLVLLSHAHMDHLNSAHASPFFKNHRAVTAKSTADLLPMHELSRPSELAWGEKVRINTAHAKWKSKPFEVKHWGARWRHDSYRGYNGYILSREGKKIIFGGDTAWTNSFRVIARQRPV